MPERLPAGCGRKSKKLAQAARRAALGQLVDEEDAQEEEVEVDLALAAFGLIAVRQAEEIGNVYLWPENVPTWNLFQAVATQWIVGVDGATGLNYQGVEVVMRHWQIPRSDKSRVFAEIQAMERATLLAWREKKK